MQKNLIVFTAIVFLIVCSGLIDAQQSGTDNSSHSDFTAVRDALRRGGLREAAKLKGHYTGMVDPHWDFGLFDTESLTKNSVVVIVGTAVKINKSRLAGGGQYILTDYEVTVEQSFKGEVQAGDSITVSLQGGRVEFEDGTSAEQKALDFEPIEIGNRYALFLSEDENAGEGYILTGGPQGLVEISADGKRITSHGRTSDPIATEVKDHDEETFLREVRKEAAKWPLKPGKCCT